jgi:hypothetical protein
MKELVRSNDPVRISFLTAYLAESGIEAVLIDLHTSVMEGSIGALQRRLMVIDDDYARAKDLLDQAGEDW